MAHHDSSSMSGNTESQLVLYIPPQCDGMIVPYAETPTAAVQEILNKFVAPESKTWYTNENIILMIWLFDKDAKKYLHD